MHGLGNDFVVFDATENPLHLSREQIRTIADRHFGVGCDQLLLVELSDIADFRYRIFNADGDEVEQCGNGARCFARFVREQGLTEQTDITVETLGGQIILSVLDNEDVRVNMGVPNFEPAALPFNRAERSEQYELVAGDQEVPISTVSMGNPHAVIMVDDIDLAPIDVIGPYVESHEDFPKRVNAGFMQIINRNEIRLRVFERGAGETLACGTGACAATVVGQNLGLLDSPVSVHLSGGTLIIEWSGEGEPVFMSGPATTVFTGELDLEAL